MSPLVSVIVPVCNVEKYLEACLDSIKNQTLKDIEVICIDDGSTDTSSTILDDFCKKDPRFTVFHKKNSGYGNSMNKGIEMAKGQYIGIVESDDFIMPKMFEDLYTLTESGKVDVVKANFWDCYDESDGTITKVVNREREAMPDVSASFILSEHPQILWGHPSIWSGIYRTDFIRENNIKFKEVKGGGWVDNPFFFETLCLAKAIKWTKKPYYCYRKTNAKSSSNEYDLKLPLERMIDNLEAIKRSNHGDEETLKFAYARALMYLIGVTREKSYGLYKDEVRPYMRTMLDELNQDVITDDFNIWDQKNYFKYRSPIYDLIPKAGKLLIYNWVPFDNPNGAGGGVTVYCKNLIRTILKRRPDIQVYFLSSGWAYDISHNKTFIRNTSNCFGDRVRSFEIVNSPVPAPIDMCFMNPETMYSNEALKNLVDEFIEDNGAFSAIHFNNLEGLSLDVFDLKEKYIDTRFVFSLHNYVPFCMTGFYFRRDKKCICDPEKKSDKCDSCIDRNNFRNIEEEMIKRGQFPVNNPLSYDEYSWIEDIGLSAINEKKEPNYLCEFAEKSVKVLNSCFDTIITVSKRVEEIAIQNGVKADLICTEYIGTKVADYQIRRSSATAKEYFKIGFLGTDLHYTEKGYPFLIDALAQMDKEIASKIDLVLTTTTVNEDDYLRNKLVSFHDLQIIHGYKHSDLAGILSGVNLGVIPVLWEDNLPQIAIEMVAYGVPVLCSGAGGTKELSKSKKFVFEAGNTKDFLTKLNELVNHPEMLDEYWKGHDGLVTMDMHFDVMSEIYNLPTAKSGSIDLEQYRDLIEENEFLYKHFAPEDVRSLLNQIDGLKRECSGLRSERDSLQNERDSLKNERDCLQNERDDANWRLGEIWKSKTYKIGRAITYLPRLLRKNK